MTSFVPSPTLPTQYGMGVDVYAAETNAELAEIDEILRDYEESVYATTLGDFVQERFNEAARHRASVGADDAMQKSVRAYNNVYDPEDAELVAKTADVYMPITNTKARGLQAWVSDILANAEDKPWTLNPTPEPDIPAWMEDKVVERLAQEALANGVSGPDFMQLAKQAKDLAKKHAGEMSAEATKRMEDRIYDQLLQAGWRAAFRAFIDDLSVFPSAVLFGPSVDYKKAVRWKNGQAVTVKEPKYVVRRVNPLDFYPSPNAENVAEATYLCEVRTMTSSQLLDMTQLVGVDQSAVRKLLARHKDGYWCPLRSGAKSFEGAERKNETIGGPARQYEVIQYYGAVDASILDKHGIDLSDEAANGLQADVDMEVWVCDGIVLRALKNPYPLGRKPYHTSTFQRKAGSFWGVSIPMLLRDLQRVANAAIRNMVRNMAFTSGPIGEYDIERLVDEDKIEDFDPFRLFAVRPDYTSGGASAIRFNKVPSNTAAFMAVYDRFLKEADDVSGIPAYVIGNPNVAGAGRTLGGLSLLMGNAAKGVKRVISDIDKDVIEPVIQMMYELNLLYSDDESIKSDAQVVARGASGLLQKELSQARSAEVLPLLMQGMQLGVTTPSSIATVMQDILKSLGYPPDLVVDPARQQQLMQAFTQGMAGGMSPGAAAASAAGITLDDPGNAAGMLQQPIQAPQLDGRSMPGPDPSAAERIGG